MYLEFSKPFLFADILAVPMKDFYEASDIVYLEDWNFF
jgi:hypothetical protein